jgi:hypothetical protein
MHKRININKAHVFSRIFKILNEGLVKEFRKKC